MSEYVEPYRTKTTRLGDGRYGCRVYKGDVLVCEMRVQKGLISVAYKDMLRTLDKMGSNSRMASASRDRPKNWNFADLGSDRKMYWGGK